MRFSDSGCAPGGDRFLFTLVLREPEANSNIVWTMQIADSPGSLTDLLPGLASLWSESLGDPRICIAVLDGPVDLSHDCFLGTDIRIIESLIPNLPSQGPAAVHGTHVASVIFGQHHSAVHGLAPRCRGLVIPVFSDGPEGKIAASSQLDLARAITQAVAEGAHIINLSGGQLEPSGEPEDHLDRAIRLCAQNGVLIVAAAGNDGCDCLHVPAAAPSVLAVGAMDSEGNPLESSNWGAAYMTQGIVAPGENIPGAIPDGGVGRKSGTSYATPIVSGIAALLLSTQLKQGSNADPYAVRTALLESAWPCDAGGVSECRRLLAGKINIGGALEALKQKESTSSQLNAAGVGALASSATIPFPQRLTPSAVQPETNLLMEGESIQMPDQITDVQPNSVSPSESGQPPVASSAALQAAPPAEATPTVTASGIAPSDCGCGGGAGKCSCGGGGGSGKPPLVYALGKLGYDYGSEARRDSFIQGGLARPHEASYLLAHLKENPTSASAVTWTLSQEETVIYAVHPAGAFAANTYERLREYLNAQQAPPGGEGAEQVSVPGYVAGKVPLLNGQVVPLIVPDLRGMYSWTTRKLVEAVRGAKPKGAEAQAEWEQKSEDIGNFLDRVYYQIRNLGLAPQERAMNYAATNAFQVQMVFESAIKTNLALDDIGVERSPICRPGSDCWDVKLTFFNPSKRLEQAREVYRFTVDVSDVVPVTVGKMRHWSVY